MLGRRVRVENRDHLEPKARSARRARRVIEETPVPKEWRDLKARAASKAHPGHKGQWARRAPVETRDPKDPAAHQAFG